MNLYKKSQRGTMENLIINILILLANPLTACIFPKKLRKYMRNKIFKIITLPFLRLKYPKSIFLFSPLAGIGEFTQSICLMKAFKEKINKNIVILTSRLTEIDICNLYNPTVQGCYLRKLKFLPEAIPENPREGQLYSLYINNFEKTIHNLDIEYVKEYFHLDLKAPIQKIVPKRPEQVSNEFILTEQFMKENKTILIFPDANTYDSSVIDDDTWKFIADEIKNNKEVKNLEIIFNRQNPISGHKNIFLPLKETIYLSSLAYGIVSFRSGITEILALTTKAPMVAIYPDGITHFFHKRCKISIEEYENKIRKRKPEWIDDTKPIAPQSYKWTSIEKNYNRKNCKDFYYNNNPSELAQFILQTF